MLGRAEPCPQGSWACVSATHWSCVSTNKLVFATKSAQIQAPRPPTLKKSHFSRVLQNQSPLQLLLSPFPTMLRGGLLHLPARLAGAEPLNWAHLSSSGPKVVIAAGCCWLCLHNSQQVRDSVFYPGFFPRNIFLFGVSWPKSSQGLWQTSLCRN